MNPLREAWLEGGRGMYPIAAVLVPVVLIVVERAQWFWRSSFDAEPLLDELSSRVRSRDLEGAITRCTLVHAPVVRVMLAGLTHLHRVDAELRSALTAALRREKPRAGRRLGWLAALAPVAAMLGVHGTATGQIVAFGHGTVDVPGGPMIDPLRRFELKAGGYSEAAHCMQFGWAITIFAVAAYALFRALEAERARELDAAAAWAVALADTHRAQAEPASPYRSYGR